MASPSKEDNVLKLILENSPLREWHFEEIVKESKVTRPAASKWLKKFEKEGLVKRIKRKARFPYFTAGSNNPYYYSRKRLYALEMMHKSGLLPALMGLKNAKVVAIFGSMAKGDWYKDSDIDVFIYGNVGRIDRSRYELKLCRNIELHIFKNSQELKEVKTGLMKNISNGYFVKGQLQDFAEVG